MLKEVSQGCLELPVLTVIPVYPCPELYGILRSTILEYVSTPTDNGYDVYRVKFHGGPSGRQVEEMGVTVGPDFAGNTGDKWTVVDGVEIPADITPDEPPAAQVRRPTVAHLASVLAGV